MSCVETVERTHSFNLSKGVHSSANCNGLQNHFAARALFCSAGRLTFFIFTRTSCTVFGVLAGEAQDQSTKARKT